MSTRQIEQCMLLAGPAGSLFTEWSTGATPNGRQTHAHSVPGSYIGRQSAVFNPTIIYTVMTQEGGPRHDSHYANIQDHLLWNERPGFNSETSNKMRQEG